MQRASAGAWRSPYRIGLGYGLVAGMVGVAQWFLTAHDLAGREVAIQALKARVGGFADTTSLVRGSFWYWLGTAAVAGVTMLVLYLLAAVTAAKSLQRQRAGVGAAWVAAAVSSTMYVAATVVMLVRGPAPAITADDLTCELPLLLASFGVMDLLAQVAARIGVCASAHLSLRGLKS